MKRVTLIIAFALFVTGCSNTYDIHVFFNNVEGLRERSEVLANGMPIGEVSDMTLHEKGVLVTLEIDKEHRLADNSTFHFFERGLLAGKQIEVIPGTNNRPIKDGDTLITVFTGARDERLNVQSLDTLLTKVVKIMEEERTPENKKHE